MGGKPTLGGRLALSDCAPQLRAELRCVLMAVYLSGVMSCGLDEFSLVVRRDRYSAVGFARELPAIDIFATHVSLPDVRSSYTLVAVLHLRLKACPQWVES
jgi:hypothetical protein